MALSRSQSLIARIKTIGETGGLKFDNMHVTNDHIYRLADMIQQRLAEDYLCIESSFSLSVVANTSTYDLTTNGGSATGFFRMKILSPPVGTTVLPVEIDLPFAEEITRSALSTTGFQVLYYRIWNGQLKIIPTPTSSATWTVWYYKTPTTEISSSTAPETPAVFDNSIVYGVLSELSPIMTGKYEIEAKRALNGWRAKHSTDIQIQYQDF